MAIFEYQGIDKKGKNLKGIKEADSIKSLRASLRLEGIFATSIKETSKGMDFSKGLRSEINFSQLFEKISVESIALATRQLATLLQSGVPLLDSLKALVEQVDSQALKKIFSQIKMEVNEGSSLADAMAKHKCFTNVYVNMVRAGETSGALEIVLERLADFTEGQSRLKSKVSSALAYPIIMMIIAILILVVLMTTVIPKITAMFDGAKVQLPLMTRILIAASNAIRSYWWLIIILLGFIIMAIAKYRLKLKGIRFALFS